MRASSVLLSVSLLVCTFGMALPPERDAICQEARHQNETRQGEGFNLGWGWVLPEHDGGDCTAKLELLIPSKEEDHRVAFWAEALDGDVTFRLVGPDGQTEAQGSGRKLDLIFNCRLAPGKHLFTVEVPKGAWCSAEFGMKGALEFPTKLDPEHFQEFPAAGEFKWPYLLFTPKVVTSSSLLVVPNNTGFAVEDLDYLRASASREITRYSKMAERFGCSLLMPIFPRPALPKGNLYLHSLSRESLLTKEDAWARVDLQLIAMIQDARSRLAPKVVLDPKVMMFGFSAAGSFVNRFAMLHPELVHAVACGAPGWPLAPVAEQGGERLDYPVGLGDFSALAGRPFNLSAAQDIAMFFFVGGEDTNDPVKFRDSYSASNEECIFRRFGSTPIARWRVAEKLYAERGYHASFVIYPGEGHAVSKAMERDLETFFEAQIQRAKGGSESKRP